MNSQLENFMISNIILKSIALSDQISIDLLKELSKNKYTNIRMHVSKNNNISSEICLILSKDKSVQIRRNISQNLKQSFSIMLKNLFL